MTTTAAAAPASPMLVAVTDLPQLTPQRERVVRLLYELALLHLEQQALQAAPPTRRVPMAVAGC